MQAWWRVLRGVYPYRWSVVLSMICAIGVGLSYASGVTVMYPVMKVVISQEGVQGWANRAVVQSRMGVSISELGAASHQGELRPTVIDRDADHVVPELTVEKIKGQFTIEKVAADGKVVDSKAPEGKPSDEPWKEKLALLAHARSDAVLTIHQDGTPDHDVHVTLHDASWYSAALMWASDHTDPNNQMKTLIYMVLFFVALCVVGSIFRYYQQFLGMTVANRVIMDLRRRTYDRIVQLPTSYFSQKGTSDLMSRLTQDTGTLTEGVSMAFGKAVQEPIKALGALIAALCIDWKLTTMIIVSVPVLAVIIRKFSKHMRKASRRALENSSAMLGIINETLIGSRVVKAYSAEGYERRRFALANKKLLKQQIKLNHYNALSRPVVETLAVILSSIPMLVAANWVLNYNGSSEALLTLLALFGAMLEPMRKLADVNAKVQQTNAAATRVFEVVDMKSEPNLSHALPKLPRHQKSIEFRDIVFSYPGHEEIVLNHISATVKAGQNVAVVGGNGSGKTTLLQLLPRLYVPTSGQIFVDGIDTATVSIRSLRKQIGLVTQDTLLFADTIYNNIAYGTRHATREQIMDASRRAFADEFITTLPEGYNTRVGEHGVRLSGGQKQRIAIARAILRDPAILVLDEAMSQIDADSENKITLALREFTKGRTTFMIAHRFQSVITADKIICLERGLVAGIGTHAQLLEVCPPYRRLYENQFRESAHDDLPVNGSNGNGKPGSDASRPIHMAPVPPSVPQPN
ncbi:MAG TPA: ABC transporter ATP-binding protein [Phycisphaerae bacterium]|jgi:ABC-type multidrug transport system fused ATPase/permease subunit